MYNTYSEIGKNFLKRKEELGVWEGRAKKKKDEMESSVNKRARSTEGHGRECEKQKTQDVSHTGANFLS